MCMYMGNGTWDQLSQISNVKRNGEKGNQKCKKNTPDKARESGVDAYLAMFSIRATPISDKLPSPGELLLAGSYKSTCLHTSQLPLIVRSLDSN